MDQTPNEPLDQLTKIVTHAGGIGNAEVERIDSSPFLQARLRARIEGERRRRAQQGSGWLAPLLVAWRAITVLVVVTIAAVLTFWFSKANASVGVAPLSARGDDISRVVTGGTCALSTTEECAISTEEVLATLFANKGGEEQK